MGNRTMQADLRTAAGMEGPKLVTKSRAAELLGIHPRSIERLLVNGELVGVKLGRSIRVVVASIDALIERRRASTR